MILNGFWTYYYTHERLYPGEYLTRPSTNEQASGSGGFRTLSGGFEPEF